MVSRETARSTVLGGCDEPRLGRRTLVGAVRLGRVGKTVDETASGASTRLGRLITGLDGRGVTGECASVVGGAGVVGFHAFQGVAGFAGGGIEASYGLSRTTGQRRLFCLDHRGLVTALRSNRTRPSPRTRILARRLPRTRRAVRIRERPQHRRAKRRGVSRETQAHQRHRLHVPMCAKVGSRALRFRGHSCSPPLLRPTQRRSLGTGTGLIVPQRRHCGHEADGWMLETIFVGCTCRR